MPDKAPSAPWVPPSLWVKIFKPQRVCVWVCCCVQHFGWVPPGLTCFLQCILLGLLWAPQFFQWVLLAVFWAPRLCLTICSGLHMGSNWAPVFLQLLVVGSRMGSSWAPVFLQVFAVGSRMGSFWAPVFCRAWCVSSKEYNKWL